MGNDLSPKQSYVETQLWPQKGLNKFQSCTLQMQFNWVTTHPTCLYQNEGVETQKKYLPSFCGGITMHKMWCVWIEVQPHFS